MELVDKMILMHAFPRACIMHCEGGLAYAMMMMMMMNDDEQPRGS
jgi:hypothetical protein